MSLIRRYTYVGPADLRNIPPPVNVIDGDSPTTLDQWLTGQPSTDRAQPFTYIVTVDGVLRIAPRQCEHVACAGGAPVLAAGEILFEPDGNGWAVEKVSNQSTGYCPDLDSWHSVATALDRLGLCHPGGYTNPIIFRVCPTCWAINVVRDDDFACVMCGEDLPRVWNVDQF